jgi:deoxycytidylate deaminase
MNTKKFFKLAKIASKFSDYNKKKVHIGAVLVYKNKIIANGWNSRKTNPIQYKYNKYRENLNLGNRSYSADAHLPCIHAEMKCLIDTKDIDIDWSKVSIFVYRESCNKTRMCKPCPSCTKALRDRGIKNIYYTTEKGYNYERLE